MEGGKEIRIEISDPVEKDNGVKKYIVYTVKGEDEEGNFQVYRRYSDFFLLREKLVGRWPGVFVPSLPGKQALGNLKEGFVESRRTALDKFVKRLSLLRPIFYSDEFRIFLRASNDHFKSSINSLPLQSHSDIINKF